MRKLVAVAAVVGLAAAALLVHHLWSGADRRSQRPTPSGGAVAARTAWPHPEAKLTPPAAVFPRGFTAKRIFLDAGHGATENRGNTSALCQAEQDFTLDLAEWLGRWLEQTGHFEVAVSRQHGELVDYRERVEQARRWRAAVFVSLHSDVRGRVEPPSSDGGSGCPHTNEAPGFTVLWSDDGPRPVALLRLSLARRMAARLRETGLRAYDGSEYRDQYQADGVEPGVFVDRHPPDRRIYLLRAATMPAVLIETHNARHAQEARRWAEEETRRAFAAAVAAALADVLR